MQWLATTIRWCLRKHRKMTTELEIGGMYRSRYEQDVPALRDIISNDLFSIGNRVVVMIVELEFMPSKVCEDGGVTQSYILVSLLIDEVIRVMRVTDTDEFLNFFDKVNENDDETEAIRL